MKAAIPNVPDFARMQSAADWLLRLQDAEGDETVVAAWLRWCEADNENLAAFRRAQAVWHAAEPAAPLMAHGDPLPLARIRLRRLAGAGWRTYIPLAFAAGLAVAAIGAAVLKMAGRGTDGSGESFATPVAGLGTSVLPDGSKVDLGARSRVTTHFSDAIRGVTVETGEAFFTVTKDSGRPFVVSAGGVQVTAVGTAFNVRRGDDRVVVAVSEGRVQVASDPEDGASTTLGSGRLPLEAGQEAVVSPKHHRIAVKPIHPDDAASWRDGVLKYENEPLAAVAADLNRYSRRTIVVTDSMLRDLPFTGTVFSGSVDEALQALAQVFPLDLVQRDDRVELVPRR
jgi:transmembrane sensor